METPETRDLCQSKRTSEAIELEIAQETNVTRLRELSLELDEALLIEEKLKVLRRLGRVAA